MSVVAIIGAGLIGRAWTLVFARAGWQVQIYDINPDLLEILPAKLHAESEILSRHQLAEDSAALLASIQICSDLESVLAGADFVQENGPERLDLKQKFLQSWTGLLPLMSLSRLQPPLSSPLLFPKGWLARRGVWLVTLLTRHIWYRWSRYAARPGQIGIFWTRPMIFMPGLARCLYASFRDRRVCSEPSAGRLACRSLAADRRGRDFS